MKFAFNMTDTPHRGNAVLQHTLFAKDIFLFLLSEKCILNQKLDHFLNEAEKKYITPRDDVGNFIDCVVTCRSNIAM